MLGASYTGMIRIEADDTITATFYPYHSLMKLISSNSLEVRSVSFKEFPFYVS